MLPAPSGSKLKTPTIGHSAFTPFKTKHDSDRMTADFFAMATGSLLLALNIFLFLSVNAAEQMPVVARRQLCYHAVIILLMSVSMLRSAVVSLVNISQVHETECLITQVSMIVTEDLIKWGLVILGVVGLALHEPENALHDFVDSVKIQCVLVVFTWIIVAAEIGTVFGLVKSENTCINLGRKASLIRGVFEILSLLLLMAILTVYFFKAKRCRRLVTAESKATCIRHVSRSNPLVGSLVLICSFSILFHWPAAIVSVLYVTGKVEQSDDAHTAGVLVCMLWHMSSFLLVPILFLRHQELRSNLRKVVCRKCLYEDDTFNHHMYSRYDDPVVCKMILSEPQSPTTLSIRSQKNRRVTVQPDSAHIIKATEAMRRQEEQQSTLGTPAGISGSSPPKVTRPLDTGPSDAASTATLPIPPVTDEN